MFQSFITSIDSCEKNKKPNSQLNETNQSKEVNLRNQIKILIDSMPSSQICVQSALNIGLPANLLDFNKLLKKIQSETSVNSLIFTVTQLKALYKESVKLKKFGKKDIQRSGSPEKQSKGLNTTNKSNKETLKINSEQQKSHCFEEKLADALKGQISFRIKVKNFYSTEKLQKKDIYIKKIMQKAKNMNKKVLKVYKTFKQKRNSQIQLFKMSSVDDLEQTSKRLSRDHNIRRTKIATNFGCDSIIPKDIDDYDKGQLTKRYNTAETGRKASAKRYVEQNQNQLKFQQLRRKQLKTRQKKRQIELEREEAAIFKLIKKHQRLNLISSEQQKKLLKTAIKNKNPRKHSLTNLESPATKEIKADLQTQIINRCDQKKFKKELILQQKVNRIRQELKTKQQRVSNYRLNIEKEHQNNLDFNQEYLKAYNQKIKAMKHENELKHELTIRSRLQNGLQKERQEKMLQSISKMNERELKKQLKKIKGNERFQSQKYINGT